MNKVKSILCFALFGFLLSFFTGFASHSSFIKIFFTALLFSAIFAVLGVVISIVWKNFLADDFDSSEGFNHSEKNLQDISHKIDITIEDESLPSDDNASKFFTGNNHQMLNKSDFQDTTEALKEDNNPVKQQEQIDDISIVDSEINKSLGNNKKVLDDELSNVGFVPVALEENAKNVSGTESKSLEEYKSNNNNSPSENNVSSQLDVLPDLEDLQKYQKKTEEVSLDNNESLIEENDDSYIKDNENKNDSYTESKDAVLMAKAISTLLSKE